MAIVLLGDVGGTNTRLQLFRYSVFPTQSESEVLLAEEKLASKSYPSFQSLLEYFLQGKEKPQFAVMGIAGPVSDNTCKLTNVGHWPDIVGDQLAVTFQMDRFHLMNDFEAAGYGVLELKAADVININEAQAKEGRPKAVIGAGTGIGECILTAVKGEYTVWPGEGGHCDFFPHDDLEVQYAQYIL